jgi:hypothetical protein
LSKRKLSKLREIAEHEVTKTRGSSGNPFGHNHKEPTAEQIGLCVRQPNV